MSLPLIIPETMESLRTFGTADFLERMLDLFLENSARTMNSALESAHAGNAAQAAFDAHALRSSAATLGLARLAEAAAAVEAFHAADNDVILAWTEDLHVVYQDTVAEVVELRDRLREASRVQ